MIWNDIPNIDLVVVYDGDCPFCKNYVQLQKLRSNIGSVRLVDARLHPEISARLYEIGLDLDEGMAVHFNKQWHFGAECITLLSSLSDSSTVRGKIWRALFYWNALANMLYPLLRYGRNLVLKIKKVSKINDNR